jgi:hypothetical protein
VDEDGFDDDLPILDRFTRDLSRNRACEERRAL